MIRRAVTKHPSLAVVGEGDDGGQAAALVELHHPDAVVMDVQMPGTDGIQATRGLKDTHPEVVVIGHSSDPSAETSMLAAGATVFVIKGDVLELLRAIAQATGPG